MKTPVRTMSNTVETSNPNMSGLTNTVNTSDPTVSNNIKTEEQSDQVKSENFSQLPLPDIVLCSALSAGIAQARRHRRQRHPATVQTPGSTIPLSDPDALMEPLIPDMEKVCVQPEPSSSKRRKTEGSRLSSVAATNVNIKQKTITVVIDDTPLGVFNGLMALLKKITSSN